ncbi:hypothetical protein BGW41_007200 [Actinomortierella wolfii]|nr:hypothetical protein BGW41_007200 [Actinomortierella wolfii]
MVVHPRLIGVLLRGRSSWKALAETDYFVLQHHPRQARLPPFRIITRGFPHYRVAEGDQLELLQDELEYLTVMARQAIVGKVTSKKISAWLKASFQRQLAHAPPDIQLLGQEHANGQFSQYEDDDEDEEDEEEEDEDLDELDELDVDDEIEVEDDEVDEDEGDHQQFTDDHDLTTTKPFSNKAQKNRSIVDTHHQYPAMSAANGMVPTASPVEIRPLKRSSSLEHVGGSTSKLSPHRITTLHHLTHPPPRPASSASVLLPPSSASASNVLHSHARTSSPEPMLDPIPRPHSAFSLGRYTLPGELDADQQQSRYPRSHSSSLPTPDASPGEMSDDSLEDVALIGSDELAHARAIRSLQHAGTFEAYPHHPHSLSTTAPSIIGAGGEPLPSSSWTWWTGSPFMDALVNWIEGPEHVARAKNTEKDKPNPLLDIPLQFIALLTYPEPDVKNGNKMTLAMVRETAFVKQRRRTLLILTVYTLLVRYCSFDFFLVLLFASNCGMLFLMKNSGRMNVNMAKRAVRQRVGWARQWAGSIFRRGNNNNSNGVAGNQGQQTQQGQTSSMTYQTVAPAVSNGSSQGTSATNIQGPDSPTHLADQEVLASSPPTKRKGLFARKMGLGGGSNSSNNSSSNNNNSSNVNNGSQTALHDGVSTVTGTPSTTTSKRRFFKRGSQPRSNTVVVAPTPTSPALHQSLAGTKSTLSCTSKACLSNTTPSASAPPVRSQTLNLPSASSGSAVNLPPNRPFSPKASVQTATVSTTTPVPIGTSTPVSGATNGTSARKNSVAPAPSSAVSTAAQNVPPRQPSPLPSPIPIPIPVTSIAVTSAEGIHSSKDVMADLSSTTASATWMGYSNSMPTIMPSGTMMPPRTSISSSIMDAGSGNSVHGSIISSSSSGSLKNGSVSRSLNATPAPTTPSSSRKSGQEEIVGNASPSSSSKSSSSSASKEQQDFVTNATVPYTVRFGPALAADELVDPASNVHSGGMESR